MKLFRLDTKGLGSFFVVDEHSTKAEQRLNDLLNKAQYGFSPDRIVQSIHLISEEVKLFGGNPKPNFTDLNRLILPETCN